MADRESQQTLLPEDDEDSQAGQRGVINNSVPVAAIGASAGGLEAFVEFLKHVSPTTGLAFVFIQHLDPSHESHLVEILKTVTSMTVLQAQEQLRIESNHVYVIPPTQDMEVIDGVLTLMPRRPRPFIHMPIDQFFASLAERQKDAAIGIVLSGMNNDGTQGLRAIRAAGGITMAQDDSAKYNTMPRAAVAEGVVDLVLPPAAIAQELERLSQQTDLFRQTALAKAEQGIGDQDEDLRAILRLVRVVTSVDFSFYKVSTIKRRIVRRMLLHKQESLIGYLRFLRQNAAEVRALYDDLLINVTTFFRDSETMDYLRTVLLPRIIRTKSAGEPFRLWVPACSTGEEAYSLAMLLTEALEESNVKCPIQVFATDLSESVIARARLGTYSLAELANVPPQQVERFFTKTEDNYRIVKSIRDVCVFAHHNLLKDPPFANLDLISCRNLLIYFESILQKRAIVGFHYALKPSGFLVLGKSETVHAASQLFSQIDKKYKIFARQHGPATRGTFHMLPNSLADPAPGKTDRPAVIPKKPDPEQDLDARIDHLLLNKYVPASVVVNSEFEILQFRGSTGLYLEPAPGKASLNLLKMARNTLAFELRNILHKSGKSGQPVRKNGLEIQRNGVTHLVSVEAVPLYSEEDERLFLVVFQEASSAPIQSDRSAKAARDARIKQLEDELAAAREDMRSIIEAQEASREELQAANEEVVSSNEELQSINEELETSKEEIESSNEELLTINQELQMRNDQLSEAYGFTEAMFLTIREATLVLDQDMRVRSANKTFYRTFKLVEEDVEGHLFHEVGNRMWNIPALRSRLTEVLIQNANFQNFELVHTFPEIGEKILLFNARKLTQQIHRREMVLVAIEDITERRRAERVLEEQEAWFHNIADNAPVMIWVAGASGQYTFLNKTWREYAGFTEGNTGHMGESADLNWTERIHPDDRPRYLALYRRSFEHREPFRTEYRLRRQNGEYTWLLEDAKPTYTPDGNFSGFIATCADVHVHRTLNDELQNLSHELSEANAGLAHSNRELQQYAYVASHDLQEPLRKITTFSKRLKQNFQEVLPEQARDYVIKIEASAKRMSSLIDDLLNFSKTTREDASFVRTDLNEVAKRVLEDFDMKIEEGNVRIHIEPLPTIMAIPVQMTQLFHNLIGNALKFSAGSNPPEITVSVQQPNSDEVRRRLGQDDPNGFCELLVRDNGIGFDPEFSDQIFVIFQRLHDKQHYMGTGIGLALCRRIALNHGGDIYAESQEGKGATFHVILPLQPPTTKGQPAPKGQES